MTSGSSSHQITEGVIWKQLLIFFFPILLGTFFQQMYNTVDTIIVGRAVGTQALAAVGTTGPLMNLVNGFFTGFSSGATVVLAQFYGARDRDGVTKTIHTSIALALAMGVVGTLFGCLAGPAILRLIKTPEDCIQEASLYTRIYFAGITATTVYNMGSGLLRAMGDSKRPMIFLIVTCFVNIVMDLLLVVVFRMGVAGAAIATVIAQAVSAVLVILALMGLPEGSSLQLRKLSFDRGVVGSIMRIGLPAGLQFTTFDAANVLIQGGINSFGSVVMAAWAAYAKTEAIMWMISTALGVAVTTFVGQNFGAQKYGRIRQSVRTGLAISVVLIGGLCAGVIFFRNPILGIYSTDQNVIAMGARILLWIMPYIVIYMPAEVFAGAMRGTGYAIAPTVITFGCVSVFRVLWVLTVVSHFHTPGVLAMSYPISWTMCAVAFTAVYLRGTWLKKPIAQCGMEPEIR